jgi:hypothetical protein
MRRLILLALMVGAMFAAVSPATSVAGNTSCLSGNNQSGNCCQSGTAKDNTTKGNDQSGGCVCPPDTALGTINGGNDSGCCTTADGTDNGGNDSGCCTTADGTDNGGNDLGCVGTPTVVVGPWDAAPAGSSGEAGSSSSSPAASSTSVPTTPDASAHAAKYTLAFARLVRGKVDTVKLDVVSAVASTETVSIKVYRGRKLIRTYHVVVRTNHTVTIKIGRGKLSRIKVAL